MIPAPHRLGIVAVAALGLAVGCTRPPPAVVQLKPLEVVVAKPTVRDVTDYEDFTGRTRASRSVDIKSQATGELLSIWFRDGDYVKAGQLLFEIDSTLPQADVDRARAVLRQNEVKLRQPEKQYNRLKGLPPGSVSGIEWDLAESSYLEAKTAVDVAQRQLEVARDLVDYCYIMAPFSGRISRRNVDPGNRVKQDETVLTRLVATDPMDVDFDIDDRTDLRLKDLMAAGTIKSTRETKVRIGRPDRDDFTLAGVINFIDNQYNAATSTILVRAEVPNPTGELSPGLFVRVRIPVGDPKPSVLVPEEAIGTDQQLKFVYVLNDKDEVVYRRVKLGQQEGPLRVVEPVADVPDSGVKPNDRVIVSGLQRVTRAGIKVTVTPGK